VCVADDVCISAERRCDEQIDCLDGSDEQNCGISSFFAFLLSLFPAIWPQVAHPHVFRQSTIR
jgi:Low-density lipoprotein receptor domain class A